MYLPFCLPPFVKQIRSYSFQYVTSNILTFFTFSVPYTIIQLLSFEPMNALNFIKITIILQHTSCYIFRLLLAYHQGIHNCTRQLFNIFCMQQSCRKRLSVIYIYDIYIIYMIYIYIYIRIWIYIYIYIYM